MRERAAELGGACRIESRPGDGTHVLVQLPLGEREVAPEGPAQPPEDAHG
jgi:nitrate/nitrite-specific signal transduction histidine kinase